MQIKITKRYHLTPVRMLSFKNIKVTSTGENMEKLDLLYTVGGNTKWYIVTMENSMEASRKIKNRTII